MKKTMTKTTKTAARELPPHVTEADLSYPASGGGAWQLAEAAGLNTTVLTFYLVGGAGARKSEQRWVLCTLNIGGRGRGQTERNYAINVTDGSICRVGRGPHVLQVVEVHLSKSNWTRLQPHVELYLKGLAAAGSIRDRISSRRAEGQMRRMNGESSWRWNF